MSAIVLLCGNPLDGVSETLSGPMEILVEANRITSVATDSTNPSASGSLVEIEYCFGRPPRDERHEPF